MKKLIEVKGLTKTYRSVKGFGGKVVSEVKAVNDISFDIFSGETISLVGESGCGKTTTGRCLIRAIEPDNGEVFYNFNDHHEQIDFLTLDKKSLKRWRRKTGMIFQDPYSSLNPSMTVLNTLKAINRIINNRPIITIIR